MGEMPAPRAFARKAVRNAANFVRSGEDVAVTAGAGAVGEGVFCGMVAQPLTARKAASEAQSGQCRKQDEGRWES